MAYLENSDRFQKRMGSLEKRENGSHQFQKFRTPACKTCPVNQLCTGIAAGGREIDRSEYAAAVEQNGSAKIRVILRRYSEFSFLQLTDAA